MTYTLKSDVDLSRHVRDAAYWHRPVGSIISRRETVPRVKGPTGSHLTSPTETRFEVKEGDPADVASHMTSLIEAAEKTTPGTTEHEHAWGRIAAHLDVLNQQVRENVPDKSRAKVGGKVLGSERTKKVGEGTYDIAETTGTAIGASGVVTIAATVASKAGTLLGPEQAEHFQHLIEHIGENITVESSIIVALTLAVHALIHAIRKALQGRKDRKITAARSRDWVSIRQDAPLTLADTA